MTDHPTATRREFMAGLSVLGAAGLVPIPALGQVSMPARPIPVSGEPLPVVGLGSSKVVQEIATNGTVPLARVLRTLVDHGGSVVDTWPRNPENDAEFGRIVSEPHLDRNLFVTTKIDRRGRDAGIAQFRESRQNYRRETIDLTQIFSLTDVDTHWPTLQQLKSDGDTRYIGVTVAQYDLYDALEEFIERESPDFIQVNYSITERRAEERLLPMARERGIAVLINRPFMNGAYFDRLEGRPLPDWAAEFDCHSWAEFSLKYILPHPAVTCVLTETTDPAHMAENALAAVGAMPDEDARARMRAFIDTV